MSFDSNSICIDNSCANFLGYGINVVRVNSNYNALTTDVVIVGDASSGTLTINLPDNPCIPNQKFIIKKADATSNAIIVAPPPGQLIEGAGSIAICRQGEVLRVVHEGAGGNWVITSGLDSDVANRPPLRVMQTGSRTYTGAEVFTRHILRSGQDPNTLDTLPSALDILSAYPCARVGDTWEISWVNTDPTNFIDLAVGAGGTMYPGTPIRVFPNEPKKLMFIIDNITPGSEAYIVTVCGSRSDIVVVDTRPITLHLMPFKVDANSDLFQTVLYFAWDIAGTRYGNYTNLNIVFFVEIIDRNLIMEIVDTTNSKFLGGTPVGSSAFIKVPFIAPTTDAQIEVRVRKNAPGGTDPRIFGMTFKADLPTATIASNLLYGILTLSAIAIGTSFSPIAYFPWLNSRYSTLTDAVLIISAIVITADLEIRVRDITNAVVLGTFLITANGPDTVGPVTNPTADAQVVFEIRKTTVAIPEPELKTITYAFQTPNNIVAFSLLHFDAVADSINFKAVSTLTWDNTLYSTLTNGIVIFTANVTNTGMHVRLQDITNNITLGTITVISSAITSFAVSTPISSSVIQLQIAKNVSGGVDPILRGANLEFDFP